jgi:uncharacterized membrane protein (UPF0136 family)
MSKFNKGRFLAIEKVGVLLSIVCAIHCLSLPIFLFFAPYLASSFAFSPNLEWILVLSSFLLAAIILVLDFRKHRQPLPLYFLVLGIMIKLVDMFLDNQSYSWLFGICLGLVISLAYWVNYMHKKSCSCKISA